MPIRLFVARACVSKAKKKKREEFATTAHLTFPRSSLVFNRARASSRAGCGSQFDFFFVLLGGLEIQHLCDEIGDDVDAVQRRWNIFLDAVDVGAHGGHDGRLIEDGVDGAAAE